MDNIKINSSTSPAVFTQESFALLIADVNTRNFSGMTFITSLDYHNDSRDPLKHINISTPNIEFGMIKRPDMKAAAKVVVPPTVFEDLGLINGTHVQRISISVFVQENLFLSTTRTLENISSIIIGLRINNTQDTNLTKPIKIYFQTREVKELCQTICHKNKCTCRTELHKLPSVEDGDIQMMVTYFDLNIH